MIETWVAIAGTAALFQTWRTALQQRLRGRLSVNAAGFVRYAYGFPAGLLLLTTWAVVTEQTPPPPSLPVLGFSVLAGLSQIAGTTLLIMAFGFRNFAVGTAYAKTEAMQGAVLALILLNETLSPLSWLGIAVSVAGVLVLSLAGRGLRGMELLRASVQPAALCGLGAGLGFSFSAIFIRTGVGTLQSGDPILRALTFLVLTNILQTLMQGAYLAWREPAQLRAAFATWRSSMWVGVLSACGSAGWFSSFALAPVALVRAVGQIEVVFTLAFSRFYLNEALRRADVQGLVLVGAGVVLVLLGR